MRVPRGLQDDGRGRAGPLFDRALETEDPKALRALPRTSSRRCGSCCSVRRTSPRGPAPALVGCGWLRAAGIISGIFAEESEGTDFTLLDAEDMLLSQILHLAMHRYHGQLKWAVDVAAATDHFGGQIPGRGIVRLTLRVFKHGRDRQLAALLVKWQEELRHPRSGPQGREDPQFHIEVARGKPGLHNIRLVVHYILVVNDDVTTQQLREVLRPMGAETQDILNSTGRMLIEQGRQEEQRRLAAKLLAKGMPPAQVAELTDLPLEEVQRLMH